MRPELTIKNFDVKLEQNLNRHFHPMFRDARAEEARRSLREIVGENAWSGDLLNTRDVATLYALVEERKLRIPVEEDLDSHNNQRFLAEAIKKTGLELGMREGDFDRTFANTRILNQMLADTSVGTYSRMGMDRIVGVYEGSGKENELLSPEHIQPISAIVASQLSRVPKQLKARGEQKAKPAPKRLEKPAPAAKEPTANAFTKRWDAIEAYCASIEDMEPNGITQFIGEGPKSALNLDKDQFDSKLNYARKALGWTDTDTPEAQKLLDGLQADYAKFHTARESGGVKRG